MDYQKDICQDVSRQWSNVEFILTHPNSVRPPQMLLVEIKLHAKLTSASYPEDDFSMARKTFISSEANQGAMILQLTRISQRDSGSTIEQQIRAKVFSPQSDRLLVFYMRMKVRRDH